MTAARSNIPFLNPQIQYFPGDLSPLVWKESGKSIPSWRSSSSSSSAGGAAAPCPSPRGILEDFLAFPAKSQRDFCLSQPQLVQLTLALLPLRPQFPQIPTAGRGFVLSSSRSTSTGITQQSPKKGFFFVVSCPGEQEGATCGAVPQLSPGVPRDIISCCSSFSLPPFPSPNPLWAFRFLKAFQAFKGLQTQLFPPLSLQRNSKSTPSPGSQVGGRVQGRRKTLLDKKQQRG